MINTVYHLRSFIQVLHDNFRLSYILHVAVLSEDKGDAVIYFFVLLLPSEMFMK